MARTLFLISPALGLVIFRDDGQGLPESLLSGANVTKAASVASEPVSPALPGLSPVSHIAELTVADFPPNLKAVTCLGCRDFISKGQGYRCRSNPGFLCADCQFRKGLPLRSEHKKGGGNSAVSGPAL